jgi:hypothetical protein
MAFLNFLLSDWCDYLSVKSNILEELDSIYSETMKLGCTDPNFKEKLDELQAEKNRLEKVLEILEKGNLALNDLVSMHGSDMDVEITRPREDWDSDSEVSDSGTDVYDLESNEFNFDEKDELTIAIPTCITIAKINRVYWITLSRGEEWWSRTTYTLCAWKKDQLAVDAKITEAD